MGYKLDKFIGKCYKVLNGKKSLTINVKVTYHPEPNASLISLTTDNAGHLEIARGKYSQENIYRYVHGELIKSLPKNIEVITEINNKNLILKKDGKFKFFNFSFFNELF